jgi:predicted phage terminase large subunit-like protein
MVKAEWFKFYTPEEQPAKFEMVLQSWDTANKNMELSDYSVCTTWGIKRGRLYLLHVYRKRLEFPELKRAVVNLAKQFHASNILIEDKASGTSLIQDLVRDGIFGVTRYEPTMDKIMRLHSVSSTIENGFIYLPQEADWLADYLHELTTFPSAKHDDQADSTSQALDWVKTRPTYPVFKYNLRRALEQGDPIYKWMLEELKSSMKNRDRLSVLNAAKARRHSTDASATVKAADTSGSYRTGSTLSQFLPACFRMAQFCIGTIPRGSGLTIGPAQHIHRGPSKVVVRPWLSSVFSTGRWVMNATINRV